MIGWGDKQWVKVNDLYAQLIHISPNDLPEFPSAALSSIDVATALPHSSALQAENPFYVILLKVNETAHSLFTIFLIIKGQSHIYCPFGEGISFLWGIAKNYIMYWGGYEYYNSMHYYF